MYWPYFFTEYVIIDELFTDKKFINGDVDFGWEAKVYLLESNHFTTSMYCFFLYLRLLFWKTGWNINLLSPRSGGVTNFSVNSCMQISKDLIAED